MMFAPFAFIQPENLADIISGASTSSLFVVGDFFTYKATNLGNVAILTNSGSRTFLANRLSSFNAGGDDVTSTYQGAVGSLNELNRIQVYGCSFENTGKLVIAGRFQFYSGSILNQVTRVNANGTRDLAWTGGTMNSTVYGVTQQRDGKYLFNGSFTTYSGSSVSFLTRTNISGTLDTTFKAGTFDSYPFSIVEDSANRLVIGGQFTTYSGSTVNGIVRINNSGSIDSTFKMGTGFNGQVYGIVLQTDGKIIAMGSYTTYSGSAVNRFVRINTDGTLDTTYKVGQTFNTFFGTQQTPTSIGIQPDDKVIIVGPFMQYSGSTATGIARVNTDGTYDSTFKTGVGFDGYVDDDSTIQSTAANRRIIVENSTNKIYVAGNFTTYSGSEAGGLIKLNSDGTIDTTFDYIGNQKNGFVWNRYDNATSKPRTAIVASIALTGSSVAAAGKFATYKEPHIGGMARLDLSGSMYQNTTMHVSGGFQYTSYLSVSVYQAGPYVIKKIGNKFIVAGDFTQYNSTSSINRIIVLNSDFSRDTTFNSGTGFNASINQIQYNETTGKILVAGNFTTYSGSTVNRIAQLNTNGTLDTGFATGLSGFNSEVSDIKFETTGKILCGGAFTTYNGATQNRIVRLNANGQVDADFKTNNGVSTVGAQVYSIAIQNDGKIVFGGGNVNTYSGSITSAKIFRTDISGAVDTTFKPGNGFNGSPFAIKQDLNNKLVVLTDASTYSGSTINRIVRIDTSGSIDTTFKTGTGLDTFSGTTYSNIIEFDANGNLYIAGGWNFYSGSKSNGLVKIKSDGSIDTVFITSGSNGTGFNARPRGLLLDTSTI